MGASLLAGATTSCSDFLDRRSPSQTTKDFVLSDPTTLRAAMQNVYDVWRSDGSGAFYDFIVSATDMENQPEGLQESDKPLDNLLFLWMECQRDGQRT